MGRWEPDARGRLRRAALELYADRGFDETSVAEIAERAGVTERTFFRHFADKREVLFPADAPLEAAVVEAIAQAPAAASPLDAMLAGIARSADVLPDAGYSRLRARVIAATSSLQERELLKLSAMSAACAAALRARGASELDAALAADAGVSAFRIAFERWVSGDEDDLATALAAAAAAVRTLSAG